MPRKKSVPWGGDKNRERDDRHVADAIQTKGDALADLDRLRTWARQGKKLIAKLRAALPSEVAALEEYNANPDDEAAQARADVAGVELMLPAMLVRGEVNGMGVLVDVLNVELMLDAMLGSLPSNARMNAVDALDQAMRILGRTREETAKVAGLSVEALDKRRTRRR